MLQSLSTLLLILPIVGCSSTPDDDSGDDTDNAAEYLAALEKTQVLFTINVHDWTMRTPDDDGGLPTNSVEVLHRALDLHEQYEVPVDIYLTDAITQLYLTVDPSLIERMATSPMVAVSYHRRPSWPFYSMFDRSDSWGFSSLSSQQEWYDVHHSYETEALELTTGEVQQGVPGGFDGLRTLMGHAPYAVGHVSGDSQSTLGLRQVYEDLGASFATTHGDGSSLGETLGGLLVRPDDVEVKLYNYFVNSTPAAEIIESAIADQPAPTGTRWVNIKYHEDNWYSAGTPFSGCFYEAPDFSVPLTPPFDFTACLDPSSDAYRPFKTVTQRQRLWDLYEDALIWASADPSLLHPTNLAWVAEAATYIEK
jgi:hypothetical protein